MRVFYTTDLHGSEVCWRKFLNAAKFYNADVLICGGDMTGKAMIPLVEDGDAYELTLSGQHQRVSREQVSEMESQIQRKGYYPVRMTSSQVAELDADPKKVQKLFTEEMCKTVERWMQLAEAPALDENLRPIHGGRALRHVGSTAVREAIDRHQPMLSLHGHIHEGKGITRLGKTLAINTGSAYEEGILMSAIVELDQKKGIKSYQLVNG